MSVRDELTGEQLWYKEQYNARMVRYFSLWSWGVVMSVHAYPGNSMEQWSFEPVSETTETNIRDTKSLTPIPILAKQTL